VQPKDFLLRVHQGEIYELGVPSGYVNQKGDTVIPVGKYPYCFSDTITSFGIVGIREENASKIKTIAIDTKEKILYEVYWFDNGPDWPEEGLFRIITDGKIGYADKEGRVVIKPQFACAEQFKDQKARVTYSCDLTKKLAKDEHTSMVSNGWFYIGKNGKKIN